MKCHEVREALPAYAREGHAPAAVRRHLVECDDCRSELERYEVLVGALGRLRGAPATPPPALLATLTDIPRSAGIIDTLEWRTAGMRSHLARNRRAYLGGAVALVGAAGAALWRTRARRLATA
jgi:hypothetical protein